MRDIEFSGRLRSRLRAAEWATRIPRIRDAARQYRKIPSVVVPSRKLTEPVGTAVLPEGPVTVAVKVTDCPLVDGFADELTVVVVDAVVPCTPVPRM